MNKIFVPLLIIIAFFSKNSSAQPGLWSVPALKKAPAYKKLNADTAKISQLLYEGEAYGKLAKTQVFAYYATPGSISGNVSVDHDLPAVVLVHGGGGYAFKEWVTLWAKRGYAAIAIDLGGDGIDTKPLLDGGPSQDPVVKFTSIDSATDKQWVYHSVSNIILAHSLIRSFKEVNPNKTSITGISWGGFLTCIVAGLDDRFKVAVPIYGCGFIYEPGGVFYEQFRTMTLDQTKRWIERYDPSRYIKKARIPFLWVTGTNDIFYPPNSVSHTYNLVSKESNYRITTGMKHGHEEGWAPKEIGEFIDQHIIGTTPLPAVKSVKSVDNYVTALIKSKTKLTRASVNYTTDTTLPYSERKWQTIQASIKKNRIEAKVLPANTTIWMINVTDEKGSIVSSPYFFSSKVRYKQ